ncbi:MAG TPA: glycosyltransferase family 39 protein [Gaiellaceae bacterium]
MAALVRLPFLGSIGPDEGGYAYVAWQWARGHPLYRGVWVDRPQGLILAYRVLISIAHSAWAIRLGAVVAGVAITLLLVWVGRLFDAERTGLVAGGLFAVAGVGPHIEGFTFNGELAAAVPSTAAVGVALVAWRRGSARWLAVAGLLGGSSLLMKQSGFDGLAVAFAVALAAKPRLTRVGLVAAGAAVPIGASGLSGWLSGWHAYWSAVIGYQLDASTGGRRLEHFHDSLAAVAGDLLPLALAALVGLWVLRRRRLEVRLALVWLGSALVAVNLGGAYWPHYYVQLLAPLCLLTAVALARIRVPVLGWATAAVIALPALAFLGAFVQAPDSGRDRIVKYALGYENDVRVARYVRSHSSPDDRVYAFVSRADFYFLADREAASRFIWARPLNAIPGAKTALARTLAAPRRPRLVVLFQRRPLKRRDRQVGAIVERYYEPVWRSTSGTTVLEERPPVTGAGPPLADRVAHRG